MPVVLFFFVNLRRKHENHVKTTSLFPDYAVLETGRNEAQAMRLAQQLREVDLEVLATTAERRSVISRLRREGVGNAMQLVLLTEADVMEWYNVGPVFLAVVTAMRDEVVAAPERIVALWRNKVRLFVLPDDLQEDGGDDDFFGMLMVAEDETPSYHPQRGRMEEDCASPILELEQCIVAAVEMMGQRSADGAVLRRYFLEGAAVESIVASQRLASSASLYRIVDKRFCQPLLKGYPVKGIQFSNKLLKSVRRLCKELVYSRVEVLDVLERLSPQRFLHFLGLTLLRRTTAETVWIADFIVREGDVQRCRRTQRDLFSSLQFRVVAAKESAVRRGMQALRPGMRNLTAYDANFLRVLLREHPCIEKDRKGYRLVSEHLNYDCARLARIVYDAHAPISLADVLAQYERRYMQRPERVSISNVRTRFPHVHSVSRGVWRWK